MTRAIFAAVLLVAAIVGGAVIVDWVTGPALAECSSSVCAD